MEALQLHLPGPKLPEMRRLCQCVYCPSVKKQDLEHLTGLLQLTTKVMYPSSDTCTERDSESVFPEGWRTHQLSESVWSQMQSPGGFPHYCDLPIKYKPTAYYALLQLCLRWSCQVACYVNSHFKHDIIMEKAYDPPLHCITWSTIALHHMIHHCTASHDPPLHCITWSTIALISIIVDCVTIFVSSLGQWYHVQN